MTIQSTPVKGWAYRSSTWDTSTKNGYEESIMANTALVGANNPPS